MRLLGIAIGHVRTLELSLGEYKRTFNVVPLFVWTRQKPIKKQSVIFQRCIVLFDEEKHVSIRCRDIVAVRELNHSRVAVFLQHPSLECEALQTLQHIL